MRFGILFAIATVLLAGCSTPARSQRGASQPPAPPEAYVRISATDSNKIALLIAVRKFVPIRGHGPAVWLAGVCHIGESNYFANLQEYLDAQPLVLYEGIGDASGGRERNESLKPSSVEGDGDSAKRNTSSLQSSMAAS